MDLVVDKLRIQTARSPHARGDGPCAHHDRGDWPRSPHARGDGPNLLVHLRYPVKESPRTWGWTAAAIAASLPVEGVPTHVGMDLSEQRPTSDRDEESPRTWGWTDQRRLHSRRVEGVPTHVGMDRTTSTVQRFALRSPHARGDGPLSENTDIQLQSESPRTWGWTASCLAFAIA